MSPKDGASIGGNGRQDWGGSSDLGKYGDILGRLGRGSLEISGSRNLVRLTGVRGPEALSRGRKCGLLEGEILGVGYKARSSSSLRSRSRSLGGSLNEESEDKKSGLRSSSSRIFRVFAGSDMFTNGAAMSRIAFVFVLAVEMSVFGAVQKYLEVTSLLGVTPGKSLEIKNPCPTPLDQVTRARISIGKCSYIEMSESKVALTQHHQRRVEELT